MTTPLVGVFDDHLYGGKATQLGSSIRAGLPVPPGFALSVDQVNAIVRGDNDTLNQAFNMTIPLNAVAVRSSAVGEDGISASSAGQHGTLLHVRSRKELKDAICHVWESGQSVSARAYRDKMELPSATGMAIVVQQLVESEMAGVMFTRNPMSGEDERIIEASWGLGEVIVAGLVTPDRYRISRDGHILERSAGEKDVAIRSLATGGTAHRDVEPHLILALCLRDEHVAALSSLACLCEQHHGAGPHDVEFAFAADKLFLLQCRPMTRMGSQ
jgi:pyruvate, water dikinase